MAGDVAGPTEVGRDTLRHGWRLLRSGDLSESQAAFQLHQLVRRHQSSSAHPRQITPYGAVNPHDFAAVAHLRPALAHGTRQLRMGWRVSRAAILALLLVLLGGCGSAGSTSGSGSHSTTTSRSATTIGVVSRVPVGKMPVFAAEDPNTHTLYVTNAGDDTVSVIRTAGCNGHDASRCAAHWPVVAVGHLPLGLAVAQATDTVYVANAKDGTVSVINGATCNGSDGSKCRQKPTTVPVGAFGDSVAVDPVSDMVFVTNQDARPGTVSVIDGHACNGRHPAGCADQPFMTVDVGSGPSGIDVNPVTNTIYVANTAEDSNNMPLPHGSTLSVIDGATCKPTNRSGCTPVGTVRVGADPANVAVDPATNSVYVANTFDNTNSRTGTVSIVSGAHCDASDTSGCASQTPPQVPVGADPVSTTFDKTTNTVYVTNAEDGTLSIIDAAGCNATRPSGCKPRPPTVTVGSVPTFAVVDTDLATIYVVTQSDNTVAVLTAK